MIRFTPFLTIPLIALFFAYPVSGQDCVSASPRAQLSSVVVDDASPIPDGFPRYNVIPIGPGTEPAALSDSGFVTGRAMNDKLLQRAFVWKDGVRTDLGVLPDDVNSDISGGQGVNNVGDVVGMVTATDRSLAGSPSSARHAFLYSHGKMTDIESKDHNVGSCNALAINNRGVIVGCLTEHVGYSPAISWVDGQIVELGRLGGNGATAYAVSDQGDVVGCSDVTGDEKHAFLYRDGRMNDLGTLGGKYSEAAAVNNSGDVVGYSTTNPHTLEPNHAFLWTHGKMLDLGTLGGLNSSASDINDAGQIVGASYNTNNVGAYFLYQNGKMVSLQRLVSRISGWVLTPFTGQSFGRIGIIRINNHGQILCQGNKLNRGAGAILLDPISGSH